MQEKIDDHPSGKGTPAHGLRRRFVFISHCNEDKPELKRLVHALMAEGVPIWIDKPASLGLRPEDCVAIEGIPAGTSWEQQIGFALEQAACVLVCWSKTALRGDRSVFLGEADYGVANENVVFCVLDDMPPAHLPKSPTLLEKKYSDLHMLPAGPQANPAVHDANITQLVENVLETFDKTIDRQARERGAQPVPYQEALPKQPHRLFHAREAQLQAVHRQFHSARGRDIRRVAVFGMPGLGKTSLAARYAWRFKRTFDGVLWFGAERRGDLVQSIAKVGKAMHPPVKADKPNDDEAVARETIRRLDESGDAILYVFDNVEAPPRQGNFKVLKGVEELLPQGRAARVLITSKHRDWRQHAHPLDLPLFTPDEAQRFLLERTEQEKNRAAHAEAAALAKALKYLPLALEQAGAVCVKLPFSQYLKHLTKYLAEETAREGSAQNSTVSATVRVSLDTAQKRCETPRQAVDVREMLQFLAFCAADSIPRALLEGGLAENDDTRVDAAIERLMDVSLVWRDSEGNYSLHRTTQLVTRTRADANAVAAAFGRVVNWLGEIHPEDVNEDNWEECTALTPHVLSVVDLVHGEMLKEAGDKVNLDRLGKLVVLTILYAPEGYGDGDTAQLAIPEPLARILGMFYEVDPLAGALKKLIHQKRDKWPLLRDQLLAYNNYVLRYALADALADTVVEDLATVEQGGATADPRAQHGLMTVKHATELLVSGATANRTPGSNLNAFELGGYALGGIYAKRPDLIEERQLDLLANHRCYPGRSILGDLMLNLVYARRKPTDLLRRNEGKKHPFWDSRWDFIAYDANAILAAELANAKMQPGLNHSAAVREEHAFYQQMMTWRGELLEYLETAPPITAGLYELVRDFPEIGAEQGRISDKSEADGEKTARDGLAELCGTEKLSDALRLLFAHPLWSVGETTAGVVAELMRDAREREHPDKAKAYRDAILGLLEPQLPWRVRLGALETAFQFRHEDEPKEMATFADGIRRYHADESSKIRGLCAENLFAVMLNEGDGRRRELEREFKDEIRFWLRDEDCWVLEHVHRYFHTLGKQRGVDVSRFIGGTFARLMGAKRGSRLFMGLNNWWTTDRETFLKHIEDQKSAIRERDLAA